MGIAAAPRDTKRDAQNRLKRIAGQVAGVQRMLDEDRPYAEILLQVAAAQAALGELARAFLRAHLETALASSVEAADPAQQRRQFDELVDLLARFFPLQGTDR